ncbi:MAG: DNA polymerase III subunit beta [Oscillospiraceae bacterium]|nr:DNA polymerase III subunit beta [Oscillospiraceae bacterium]
MRFTCPAREIADAVANVQRVVSSKPPMPALGGILIQAKNGTVTLTGYDAEVGVHTSIAAGIEEEGELVLDAKRFSDILHKQQDVPVLIYGDQRARAGIEAGSFNCKIQGTPAEEYPALPDVEGGVALSVSVKKLREMIRQTVYAAAKSNETKPIHTGVKFTLSGGQLLLAAIDGFRLALRKEAINYTGEPLSFVVPQKALAEIMNIDVPEDAEVSVIPGARHISFEAGNFFIVSRLLDGEFMNYEAAIPMEFRTDATVNTALYLSAVDKLSPLIEEKLKSPVRTEFMPEQGTIDISCETAIGTARSSIGADISGDPLVVGFNNRFLMEALRACDTDEIRVKTASPLQPVLLLPPEGDHFLFMVLPVRLRDN